MAARRERWAVFGNQVGILVKTGVVQIEIRKRRDYEQQGERAK